ncbi:MAG: UbiA family prenyltransferase, partial [Gammaproteobacteria bacterium]|nr:UbiA family prenyltransferase [Gammaproteobacteria bacterium]
MASIVNSNNADIPLAVDLDGTLIRSDLLVESLVVLLKTKPLLALLVPFWLFRGKAWVKSQIARHTRLSPRRLPVNPQFRLFLDSQKGRKIFLATASNEKFAADIARFFGFDGYFASTESVNLTGETKRRKLVEEFGEHGYDYAGDSEKDLPVWQSAREAILVNSERQLERHLANSIRFKAVFDTSTPSLMRYLSAMRVYQWLKNLLIFVPLLVAHKFDDSHAIFETVMAFFAFSLCASSVYVLNDLFDLPDDRLHPNKRNRPIASGDLPIKHALFMIPILLLASVT